jgi:hypothetical protein
MAMILYIADPHSLFLVATHHCRGCRNAHLIHPAFSFVTQSSFIPSSRPPPLFALLALHVRRGNNVNHCTHLGNWTSRYMGFNEFPGLPDRFAPPVPSSGSYDDYGYDLTPEQRARFRANCFPDLEQIISCVRKVHALLLPTTKLTCMLC